MLGMPQSSVQFFSVFFSHDLTSCPPSCLSGFKIDVHIESKRLLYQLPYLCLLLGPSSCVFGGLSVGKSAN